VYRFTFLGLLISNLMAPPVSTDPNWAVEPSVWLARCVPATSLGPWRDYVTSLTRGLGFPGFKSGLAFVSAIVILFEQST